MSDVGMQQSIKYSDVCGLYIPCIDDEAKAHLEVYKKSGYPTCSIESLDVERCAGLEESIAKMNFTHSRRKSCALLHHFGATQHLPLSSRLPVSENPELCLITC